MRDSEVNPVDIAFDCLPLRTIGRFDVPIDASPAYRQRCVRIKAAIDARGADCTYYLYNGRCLYRFANSEVDGSCRFEFEGVVQTDAGGGKTESCDLQISLTSDTCGGTPPDAVVQWLHARVRQAVEIEFDRMIAAGRGDERLRESDPAGRLSDLANLRGMGV
ncbi:MAG: hypothetical protein AAF961_14885 [Planctomycetota bacterium]